MTNKTYYASVTTIFIIVATLHFLRAMYGWEANIGGAEIPVWVSWAALLIAGYLAVRGIQGLQKCK